MPWVTLTEGGYRLRLLDGYLTTPKSSEWRAELKRKSLERVTLECLAARSTAGCGRLYRPDPFHIWIIGNDTWLLNPLPDPIALIAEEDANSAYRILLFGYPMTDDVSAFESGFRWDTSVRNAGLTRRKKHSHWPYHRCLGKDFLYSVYESWQSVGDPCIALSRLNIPYEHKALHQKSF